MSKTKLCPDCRETIGINVFRCECGWKNNAIVSSDIKDPYPGRCAYSDNGLRCSKKGNIARNTTGISEKWYCVDHFRK